MGLDIFVIPDYINLPLNIMVFLILFYAIKKNLWGPITKMIDSRHEVIMKELTDAENKNLDAEAYLVETKKMLDKAKVDAKDIIDVAKKNALANEERIVKDAENKSKKMIESAELRIERDMAEARENIKDEIVDVALMAAEKVVGESIDQEKHEKLINDFIKEAGDTKWQQ